MHKNFVVDFDCPLCPPPWLPAYFNLHALTSVTNTFDLLMLDHSLEYFTHSTKRALIKAIASLQQSTHKAKCTLYGRFCRLCFICMCMYCKIIFPIS